MPNVRATLKKTALPIRLYAAVWVALPIVRFVHVGVNEVHAQVLEDKPVARWIGLIAAVPIPVPSLKEASLVRFVTLLRGLAYFYPALRFRMLYRSSDCIIIRFRIPIVSRSGVSATGLSSSGCPPLFWVQVYITVYRGCLSLFLFFIITLTVNLGCSIWPHWVVLQRRRSKRHKR